MSIKSFAWISVLAFAAGPIAAQEATPPTPQEIDLDALARAKDARPAEGATAAQGGTEAAPQEEPAPSADAQSQRSAVGAAPPEPEPAPVQTATLPAGKEAEAVAEPPARAEAEEIDLDAMARARDAPPADAQPKGREAAEPESQAAPEAATPKPADVTPPAPDKPGEEGGEAGESHEAPADDPAGGAATDAPPTADEVPAPGESEGEAARGAQDSAPDAAASEAEAIQRSHAEICRQQLANLLDAAERGDWNAAVDHFDANMRVAMPAERFREAWQSLAQFGRLEARGQMHAGKGQGYYVVNMPLIFERANLYAQIACAEDGTIAGFYVKPLELPQQ